MCRFKVRIWIHGPAEHVRISEDYAIIRAEVGGGGESVFHIQLYNVHLLRNDELLKKPRFTIVQRVFLCIAMAEGGLAISQMARKQVKVIDHSVYVSGFSCTLVASISVISVVLSGYRCIRYSYNVLGYSFNNRPTETVAYFKTSNKF